MQRIACRFSLAIPLAIAGWIALFGQSSSGVEPHTTLDGRTQVASGGNPAAPASLSTSSETASHYVGVTSCAASNCHGGDGTHGLARSEYSIWIQDDPHSRAYSTLFDQDSRRMARNLKLKTPAHQATICLNCHSPTATAARPTSEKQVVHTVSLTDGVGCESCHGPAASWLGPHVRFDWKTKSATEKSALGFSDTKNLLTRGRACAQCHVGSAGRDVNHDLIAAGHPRLFFELSAFNANMPHHWNPNDDRRRHSAEPAANVQNSPVHSHFEATLWAIGQLTTAEAAVNLLAERANPKNPVWPEFTEYECYACHHDLAAPSWRQDRAFLNRRIGSYPWNTWNVALLPVLSPEVVSAEILKPDGALRKLEHELSNVYPDRQAVQSLARQLSDALSNSAENFDTKTVKSKQLAELLTRLASNENKLAAQSWDSATQLYLATVAVHQGLRDLQRGDQDPPTSSAKSMNAAFEKIRQILEFPHGFNSPKQFSSDPIKAIQAELKKIREAPSF